MNDALGNVTYQYDQLSRLTAETRTFTGVSNPSAADGKFKLSYDYNLAGALKKITDATNMSIVYGYDTAARINSVTGADNLYASVSQYANTFSYRAWGALKNFTDGTSHVISRSYNSRLQTSQFSISGNVATQTFDYFNDGRIKFLDNVLDGNFDRSFSYDQMGRLVAAASGGAARQDAGGVPYNQTFGYDVFSNLNARSTTTWNQFTSSDSATYVNNRRNGWEYDNDGRNTGIEERNYYFDAAGQSTRLEGPMWISALEAYITKVMDSNYDGDGQKVKEVTWDYYAYQPTVTMYYLRSTVLDGGLVSEIDGAGQKQVGYVYAGDRILAKQTNNQVSWKHTSPAGTSEYNSVFFGGYARIELDPFNANVTLYPTTPPEHQQALGELGEGYFGGIMDTRLGDITNTNGCILEGVPQSCDFTAELINSGSGPFAYTATGFPGPPDPFGPFGPADYHPGFLDWLERNKKSLTADTYHTLELEYLSDYPKDSLKNPSTLSSKTADCSIFIDFRTGQFKNLPVGPGEVRYGYNSIQGLGFVVTVSVTTGGIGHIGPDPNPSNPNGTWSVHQASSALSVINGQSEYEFRPEDVNLESSHTASANQVSWYDHPGALIGGGTNLTSYSGTFNFTVTATNGKKKCEKKFQIKIFFGEHNSWSVSWDSGNS